MKACHARTSQRRQRRMPTKGSTKRRNSVKACQTSCRLRYSKETSLRIWLAPDISRRRKSRSTRVRYRPCMRKTRKEASAAVECAVDAMSVSFESNLVLGDG